MDLYMLLVAAKPLFQPRIGCMYLVNIELRY